MCSGVLLCAQELVLCAQECCYELRSSCYVVVPCIESITTQEMAKSVGTKCRQTLYIEYHNTRDSRV